MAFLGAVARIRRVAVAWLLSCVFVRVLEDRGLIGRNRIAGPGAMDGQRLFFELAPSLTEREYLMTVFRELSRLPAARELFDGRHNPIWKLAPTAEATRKLLTLFRTPDAETPAFRFGSSETRFLRRPGPPRNATHGRNPRTMNNLVTTRGGTRRPCRGVCDPVRPNLVGDLRLSEV